MLTNCNSSVNGLEANISGLIDEDLSDKLENCLGIVTNSLNFLLNLINIIVFSNEEFQKPSLGVSYHTDLFKYYLFKSVLDFFQSILNLTIYITFLATRYDRFKVVVFQVYYFSFGTSSFCSSASEIMTTLVLLLSTAGDTRLNKFAKKIEFYRVVLVMFAFGVLFNWYRVPLSLHFSECISAMFDAVSTSYPSWIRSLSFMGSFIRDALFPIILMITNMFLLFQYKINLKKKNRMVFDIRTVASIKQVTNLALAKMTKFKMEITKMTLIVGLKSIICHLPLFLTRFNFSGSSSTSFYSSKFYYIVSLFLFDFSFCTDFFIYFFFNKKFKAVLLSYFIKNSNKNA